MEYARAGSDPGLAEALVDKNDVVRQAAAAALEGMGASAVMVLIEVMKNSKDPMVSRAVVDMLQKIGSQPGIDAAKAWLN